MSARISVSVLDCYFKNVFGFFFLTSGPYNLRFCLTSFFRLKPTLTSSSEIEKNSPFAVNIDEPISLVSPLSFRKFHVASASFSEKNLYVNFRALSHPDVEIQCP